MFCIILISGVDGTLSKMNPRERLSKICREILDKIRLQVFCIHAQSPGLPFGSRISNPGPRGFLLTLSFFIWKFATRSSDRSTVLREKKASGQDH